MNLPRCHNPSEHRDQAFPELTQSEPAAPVWSLIDWYLTEQRELTAVETFSRVQTQCTGSQYRALLPSHAPGPGEQYAFDVDLDRCSGCKACVSACHSLNGLDDQETWRDVGLLVGGNDQQPFLQHVTTACHHCLDPACMHVCPTLAYEKDPITGIVKHLDDQCFGCQYCILACPYNAPKYNSRLGIVRKCDLCSQRLQADAAPACVQACPHQAIRIHVISSDLVQENCETSQFLPGTPDPQLTLPTTNFHTNRALPRNLIPADYFRVQQTEHAHLALVAMLVLTQMAVGGILWLNWPTTVPQFTTSSSPLKLQVAFSLITCIIALTASLGHLGRPWLAYRALLGLKTSWLSREILLFGMFAPLLVLLTWEVWQPELTARWGVPLAGLHRATLGCGIAGIFCSAMIYHRTRRPSWHVFQTGLRFGLTTVLLGLALRWLSFASHTLLATEPLAPHPELLWSLLTAALMKTMVELGAIAALKDRLQTPRKRSALLLIGPLRRELAVRFFLLGLGGVFLPTIWMGNSTLSPQSGVALALTSLLTLTLGEALERSLFFKASVAFRMPGGLAT